MEQSSVLADLRVVEVVKLDRGASMCGRMLAQLGADVLMIEPPQGHALRHCGTTSATGDTDLFEAMARAKRSLSLDLASAEDCQTLGATIDGADVLLVDRPCYLDLVACGLLEGPRDSLVVCCISPYGLSGPFADRVGSELTVQALAGVLESNGQPGDPPLQAGIPVAACGAALYALIAILAALYERQHSGLGQLIDQSAFDAVISFQGTLIPGYLLTGEEFRRVGNRHNLTGPWNHYQTRDDWIVINTVGNEQWASLARLIGRPELVESPDFRNPPDRLRNVDALDAIIDTWTRQRSSTDALAQLESAGVLGSRILSLSQALQDPHAIERMVERHDDGVAAKLPFRLEGSPAGAAGKVPRLNRHNEAWPARRFPIGHDKAKEGAGPLAGVRAVEVGVLTAGPLVGRILGMLGADVVKVESPRGERARHMGQQIAGSSYMYHLNNTDKSSCALDVDTPEGRATLDRLMARADIFITNVGEAALDAMGVGLEAMKALNPALIYGMTSGYGSTGSGRGRKAFDTTIQASTGVMSLTGMPDGNPLKVALSIVDLLSGLSATAGILAALVARERDGRGRLVDASLFDAGLWTTQEHWPALFAGGATPGRMGNRHRCFAPYGCFRAVDGWVALAVETDEQWAALLGAIGRSELVGDARFAQAGQRVDRVDEVEAIVGEWIKGRRVADVVERCNGAGVAASAVSTLSQAVEHPLTRARQMLIKLPQPSAREIRFIGAAIKMSRSQVSVRRAAPGIGERNEAVCA